MIYKGMNITVTPTLFNCTA
uniref:Uncharacterized protein n=1 Tax=Anguilla anguilla TaxID=7936 RepID=A0A0E9RE43_ANGAN